MYILLLTLIPLFVIWDTQSPATAAWRLVPLGVGVPVFLSGYCILILTARSWGRRLVDGTARGDPDRRLKRFNIGIFIARAFIPVWFAVGVFLLGWGNPLFGPIARWPVTTPVTLLGVLPALITVAGLWWAQFPVDRAVREQNLPHQLDAGLPVFAPADLRAYLINKLRGQLLFVLVPWLTIQSLHDAMTLGTLGLARTAAGKHWLNQSWVRDWGDSTLSMAGVVMVLLISPELLRRVLHTERLPDLPLRNRLNEICQRSGIRCRDILLWRTHHNMGNAAMMGVVPWVRYVILSDLLLVSMTEEQIQAVFAHELGHVKHRHLIWFAAFLLAFSGAVVSLLDKLESHLKLGTVQKVIFELSSVLACGLGIFVVYGFLSRWFERQADVYAVRALQAAGHTTGMADQHSGATIFASALQRVALVNNIPENARNWTHGSIAARVRYIRQFGRDPRVAERFDRTGRRVVVGLSALIILCTAIAVYGGLHW